MRVQIVHNQHYFGCVGVPFIHQHSDLLRPIDCGSAACYIDESLAGKWFEKHEYVTCSVALVFGIKPLGLSRFCGNGSSNVFKQLFTAFIHANHGEVWIVGALINVQYRFHVANEFSVGLRGNTPFLFLPRFDFVFLKADGLLHGKVDRHIQARPFDQPANATSTVPVLPAELNKP